MELKEIKKELLKTIKYSEGQKEVAVKIYNTDEEGFEEYITEIFFILNGSYEDSWLEKTFTEIKEASKRASSLKNTITKWVHPIDDVTLCRKVEVYHV